MNDTDLFAGLSMHFDSALPKGTGASGPGEFNSSSIISGSLDATPSIEWTRLKNLLSLPDPALPIAQKRFTIAYVPYVDGRIHYHQGVEAVLSAEYSGCLMAIYMAAGQRRVAHVPKSAVIKNDSIGEFRDYFAGHTTLTDPQKAIHVKNAYALTHYFQPFVDTRDGPIQLDIIGKLIVNQVIADPYGFSVFGLVTGTNKCASVWAIKPKTQPLAGEMWHIVAVRVRAPQTNFVALGNKINRAALNILPE